MKRLFIFGVCVLVVLCMASCYPEGPDYVHEKDIALTHYDEEADFSTLKTFVILSCMYGEILMRRDWLTN
jgi:hypothetical protein